MHSWTGIPGHDTHTICSVQHSSVDR